jgi:hypothetical protein
VVMALLTCSRDGLVLVLPAESSAVQVAAVLVAQRLHREQPDEDVPRHVLAVLEVLQLGVAGDHIDTDTELVSESGKAQR